MNEAPANPTALELGDGLAEPKPQGEGWSQKKWLTLVAVIFAALALFFAWHEIVEFPWLFDWSTANCRYLHPSVAAFGPVPGTRLRNLAPMVVGAPPWPCAHGSAQKAFWSRT